MKLLAALAALGLCTYGCALADRSLPACDGRDWRPANGQRPAQSQTDDSPTSVHRENDPGAHPAGGCG